MPADVLCIVLNWLRKHIPQAILCVYGLCDTPSFLKERNYFFHKRFMKRRVQKKKTIYDLQKHVLSVCVANLYYQSHSKPPVQPGQQCLPLHLLLDNPFSSVITQEKTPLDLHKQYICMALMRNLTRILFVWSGR